MPRITRPSPEVREAGQHFRFVFALDKGEDKTKVLACLANLQCRVSQDPRRRFARQANTFVLSSPLSSAFSIFARPFRVLACYATPPRSRLAPPSRACLN